MLNESPPTSPDPKSTIAALQSVFDEAISDTTRKQKDELQRTLENLQKDAEALTQEHAILSFHRAADAIKQGIRIFISYKRTHKSLANRLKELILAYGDGRVAEVFVAEQSISGAANWRQDLEDAIRRAHWFVLLLPDIEFEREWPIYEAGYFKRGMSHIEKLICVHHPNVQLVAQLEDFQSYTSTKEHLEKMFTELFFRSDAIIGMSQICDDELKKRMIEDIEGLSRSFSGPQPKRSPHFCTSFIEISHRNGLNYRNVEDLKQTEVTLAAGIEEIFGRRDGFRGTFGELIQKCPHDGWVRELGNTLQDQIDGFVTDEIEVPFEGFLRGTAFRPLLHCVHRLGEDGPIAQFHIVFVKEPTLSTNITNPELAALETSLRWCYRSWFEVLSRFDFRLKEEDVDTIRRFTERAEQEAMMRGSMDPEAMLRIFADDDNAQDKLRKDQEDYYENYRNPHTHAGAIDRAFRDRDPILMRKCLEELKPRVLWFLKEGSKRYAQMLAQLE